MTIIGLQRRLVEVGRIRMGEKNERGLPTRLETWKLTSRDELRLRAAAKTFGGEVTSWDGHDGQFALVTEVDSLPILLMPGQAISQHYELWSGGGCKRRCDGVSESISDKECLCDPDNRECKPHTRLNVLLPDVQGIGCWRLDTQGYYAAVELTGTVDLLEIATMRGVLLPARLRIDQRAVLRDGQTKRFPVPTLDIDVRPLEMHAITQGMHEGEVATLPSGYKPVAALNASSGGVDIAAGLAGADAQAQPAERTSGRAAAPMGEVGDFESGEAIAIPDENEQMGDGAPPASDEDVSVATADQQKLLMATAREHEWKDADRYELTARICGEGIRSVKKVPKDKVDELLTALTQGPEILEQIKDADASKAGDDIPLAEPPAVEAEDTRTNDQLIGELRAYGDALSIRQQVDAAVSQHTDDRSWLQRQLKRLIERYEEKQRVAG